MSQFSQISRFSFLILKIEPILNSLLWSHLICWRVILLCFLKNCDKLNILGVPKSPPPLGDKWREGREAGRRKKTDGVIVKSMWDTKPILLQSLKDTFSMPCGCRPCSTVSMVIKSYWHAAYTALVLISKDELNYSLSPSEFKSAASPLRQATPRRHTRTAPTYGLTGTSLLLQM